MKKKDLNTFKALLLEDKRKILNHLEDISENSENDLESNLTSGDSVDLASLEINQANLQKIGKRETYLLKKIDHALKKIDEGEYGICENCGEEIGIPRLTARPVAQLCIDCKTEQENIERRYSTEEEEEDEDDLPLDENEEL